MFIKSRMQEYLFSRKWRKENSHNETYPVGIFNQELVSVGKKTYGRLYVSMFNDANRLIIGNYCSIGPKVAFMLSSDHALNHMTTFLFKVKYGLEQYEGISKGDIVINDDVWIGYGAVILSGVHIGQGAVIAAGAIVTKDVPPYAIVGGNPAKVIKYRFKEEIIDRLLKIDFSTMDDSFVINNIESLYKVVDTKEDVDKFLESMRKEC